VTSILEPAILNSVSPASAAGLFNRVNAGSVNPGARSSGSFAELCAAQFETQPAHEAPPTVPANVPAAGGIGSQKLPGKASAANLLAGNSQQNIAAAPVSVLSPIVPMPVPAILNAALPEPSVEAPSSPAAGANAGNALAGTTLGALALDSALPAASGPGEPAAAAQPMPAAKSDLQLATSATANSHTRIDGSVLSAPHAAEDVSAAMLSTVHSSTAQLIADQPVVSAASAGAPAAANVPYGQITSLAVPQINVTQIDVSQAAVGSPAGPDRAAGASDISSVQGSGPGKGASASSTSASADQTQPSMDTAEASATGGYMPAANIESSMGLPSLSPSVPSIEPKVPAVPQPSPQTPSTGKTSAPAPAAPTAVHPPENGAMPRFATELRPTPAPSATQPANSSANSSVIPLPVPKLSGNLSTELSSNSNSKSGSQSFPAPAAQGQAPSAAASQIVTATSAAEDNSQSSTADNSAPESAPHKTAAVAAAQAIAPPPASPPTAGIALADPAMQATMQTATSTPPQGIASETTAATPASAHPSDSRGPTGADSPLNLPASAEVPVHPSTGPVQMAQIVSQAAQSEMRIGMNTAAFGNVEVRTVVHANDVGVLIGSEKGDLRSLLANELPSIASTLQQQNLRLNQVNFHQTGFAFSNQMSSGGDAQPRWSASRTMAITTQPAEAPSAELSEPSATLSPASGAGLSILA